MKKAAGVYASFLLPLLLGRSDFWSEARMSCSPVGAGRVSVWTAGVPPPPALGTTWAGEATTGSDRLRDDVPGAQALESSEEQQHHRGRRRAADGLLAWPPDLQQEVSVGRILKTEMSCPESWKNSLFFP